MKRKLSIKSLTTDYVTTVTEIGTNCDIRNAAERNLLENARNRTLLMITIEKLQ